jgi:hypothetical protein
MLKKVTIVFAIVLLALVAAQASHNGSQRKVKEKASLEKSYDEDCEQMFSHSMTDLSGRAVGQEEKTLSRSEVQVLNVEGSPNGGVSIKGWDKPDILIRACKLVGAETQEEAQALLNQLTISTDNGRVRAQRPDKSSSGNRQTWVVQFRIYVPRDLAVEASVHNGGLSLTNLVGKINGRSQNGGISIANSGGGSDLIELYAVNGGISLNNVEGKVNAKSANGGITLSGGRGEVRLHSQNGGMVVRLPEGQWSGETLEAHSDNGGVTLEVPPGFGSGIEAESSPHARLECNLPECSQVQRDLDDNRPKRVQIGGTPVIHVSTRNGGLRIVQSR